MDDRCRKDTSLGILAGCGSAIGFSCNELGKLEVLYKNHIWTFHHHHLKYESSSIETCTFFLIRLKIPYVEKISNLIYIYIA